MYNYSDITLFGFKSNTERYLWAGWLVFVVVSSLLGDSLILIASIKYKAFNLHKMIVTFIQHMAVCDLLNAVGSVAPAMLSAIYDTGSPHRFIDVLRSFIMFYTSVSSSLFISALVMGKLLLLKYPLELGSISKKHVHKLCAGIWVVCASVPVLKLAIIRDDVVFDYRINFSSYLNRVYTSNAWKIIMPVAALLFFIAPAVILVVSTVLILQEARKVVRRTQESLRWQGITTVVLTAIVYVTAFLPMAIYLMARPLVKEDPEKPGLFYIQFFRVANGVLLLNILSNFFIYSLTVTSFREFLVIKFYQIVAMCWRNTPSNGEV